MALLEPSDQDDAASGVLGLSEAQLGSVAEDQLATAAVVSAPGAATVAFPLVDLGFDLYLRRIRTLRAHPVQVKARSFLTADGEFQASIASLHRDPSGYVFLPYVPPPDWQLHPRLWAVPIPEFLKLAQPHGSGYLFSGYLDGRFAQASNQFLLDVPQLRRQWLERIPGWKDPVPALPLGVASESEAVPRPASRAFGKYGELWLASQLMRAGLQNVVIAQDRLRVDCVDFLLHDLQSYAIGGLAIHTTSLNARGIVQFRIRQDTFFIDKQLLVVVLPCGTDGELHDTAFVIPSEDVPAITTASVDRGDPGYQGSFRLEPLAAKMRPFAVPMERLGVAVLERLFPGRRSDPA
ncbi:MAG: hypothetical protein M3Z28_13830 [Candidatus Dormibacteraeota bacterium]|nr:hypothetical protein [Candidatus Dormibacteraeota bacterium]